LDNENCWRYIQLNQSRIGTLFEDLNMSYTLHEKVFIQMLVEKAFRPEDSRRMIDITALVEGDVSRFISNYDCYATLEDPESSVEALLESAKQMTHIAANGENRMEVEKQINQLFIELADNHFEGQIYTGATSYMPHKASEPEPTLRIRLAGADSMWFEVNDAASLRNDIEHMAKAVQAYKLKCATKNADVIFQEEVLDANLAHPVHEVHVRGDEAMFISGTILTDDRVKSEYFSISDIGLWVDFMLEHELPVLDMFTPSPELQNRLEAFARSRASQTEAEAEDPLAPAVEANAPGLK
jgi:hypothetical protein